MPDLSLICLNRMFTDNEGVIDAQPYIPIGPLSLVAFLERNGVEVDLIDYQANVVSNPFGRESFFTFLDSEGYEIGPVVGISCMGNLLPYALFLAGQIKERFGSTIVLGGVGPTPLALELVEGFDFVDVVCFGEGEYTLLDLVQTLRASGDLVQVDGIAYRSTAGKTRKNPPRERIADLDALPLITEVFDTHLPWQVLEHENLGLSLMSSRGCPYTCGFCTVSKIWQNQVHFRSIDNVFEELRFLRRRFAKRVVLFQDENFIHRRERTLEFCERMHREDLGLMWKCFGRIDHVDEALLKKMRNAGCIQIRYGIESGSNRILDRIGKGFTIEQAYEAVKLSAKYIPSVHASFIFAYPFETWDDFQETLDAMVRFEEAGATILTFQLSPLPGNQIYEEYRDLIDYSDQIIPEFVITGLEAIRDKRLVIKPENQYIFDFIKENREFFPGFFHYDFAANVRPKVEAVDRFNFRFRKLRKIKIDTYDQVDL